MPTQQLYSRREVEGLIAAGQTIIIFEHKVLRLSKGWKDRHPGGKLVLEHMVGRDASDEINAMHTQATLATMNRFCIGRVAGNWINMAPPIQGGVYRPNDEGNEDDTDVSLDDDASVITDSGIDCGTASDTSSVIDLLSSDDEEKDGLRKRKLAAKGRADKPITVEAMTPAQFVSSAVQAEIDADLAKYPSLDFETQRDIAVRFQALHQRIRDENYYQCRYLEYGKEMVRYLSLLALFIYTLRKEWYFVSACFLGLFWHQIMFTAHDAGHRGITRNINVDTAIGIFIADFCCGLSIGWWKSSHNVHHLVTNAPEHDPDIQNIPLFATAPAFLQDMKSTYYDGFEFFWDAVAAVTVRVQKYTYYPVMGLARFNLYILSWGFLLSSRSRTKGKMWWTRPTEILGISCYFFLYFYVLLWCNIPTWTSRAIFILTSHLVTMPLHVQITLSHWGTSTADLGPGESFAQRQLRTTMDVSCPEWLDFIHGGLQFQAVHHLFPRVPRHNLRKLQALVQEFCAETEIEYLIHGFAAGNGVVLSRLEHIAEQARIMAACQKHMAVTGESGLH